MKSQLKKFSSIVFTGMAIVFSFTGCDNSSKKDLIIAAAGNLNFVMPQLVAEYKKQNENECQLVFGSSGKLFTQIKSGAPYDIYLSADTAFPNELYKAGLTEGGLTVFTKGRLALWSNIPITESIYDLLNRKDIQHIGVGNPKTAPYGGPTLLYLRSLGNIYSKIEKRIMYGESVSQVNQFVLSKSVEVGFTSLSSIIAANLEDEQYWREIPANLYPELFQGVVVLKSSKRKEEAIKFVEFLKSEEAQAILKNNGYQ